jgi:putative ABC transport system substrate-binding protein
MTTRRKMLLAFGAGALAAPLSSLAQQSPVKVYRIGILGAASPGSYTKHVEALRLGLRELGYVEGKNLLIEFRWAEGNYERLPELAAELVRLKVDVLVTHATPGSRAAKQATTTIPIVIASIGDAVTSGVVASEARPGGNITGSSFFSPEVSAKWLEVLKEAFPRIRRIAVFLNSDNAAVKNTLRVMEGTAAALKLELQPFGVRSASEFESAFAAMGKQRIEGVAIYTDPMMIANARAVASLATKYRIPSIGFIEIAEAGGLLAYGIDLPAMWRRVGYFVDKILKGANPGDLPVERATKFELVVNMKTAKAIGITIPQSLVLRADKVIE